MAQSPKKKTSLFYWYHSFIKWIYHFITGRCELERICYNIKCRVTCNLQIENSLLNSKSKVLNEILTTTNIDINKVVQDVLNVKKIDADKSLVFIERFSKCVVQISGYIDLIDLLGKKTKIVFSCDNAEHEKKLLQLWSLLMPDTVLESRLSSQWGEIGFQGKNPATDFRGMGILGLENLLYFASKQNNVCRKVLSESRHPKYWYSFAIVGINITALSLDLLKTGALKPHFYNTVSGKPTMDDFHKVYCYLFRTFSAFWLEQKPASVMEFNRIRDEFRVTVVSMLQNPSAILDVENMRIREDDDVKSVQSISSQDLE
ncbi:ELMO domain-containing protein 1-like [Xenia sp. Carnegie-2017]|uniref:ELMO domain-containing protein 1-like n=1 Tax=Xenia sp. Carnegie-2017 TaxID=2897299 RepID=UPI001F038175|nr:ELMO domain-containing protein 1-like [Xenia sp. Carnegie-2017]